MLLTPTDARRATRHGATPVATTGADTDAGFTLTELLVAVIVGGLVLLMVGSFLVTSMQADRQLRGLNDASTKGELALDAMRTSLQSAVPPIAIGAGIAAGDLVLRTRVASTGAGAVQWDCIAYYFDAALGEVRMQRHTGTESTPAVRVADPDATSLAGWPIVASGVLPPVSGEVFSLRDRDPGPGYEADPGALEVQFRIDAGDLGESAFSTTVVARSQAQAGAACAP